MQAHLIHIHTQATIYSMNISGFFDYYALLNVYKTVITLSIFTGDIQPSVYHFYFIVKKKTDHVNHKEIGKCFI